MRLYRMLLLLFFIGFSGCDNKPDVAATPHLNTVKDLTEDDNETSDNENEPVSSFPVLYVYSDKGSCANHYVPSGFMPNGKCIDLNESWTEGCYKGKTCIKIVYDLVCSREGQKWGGIYWLSPPNNWGQRKGGYDLTGARRLTFWAKGTKGGEQIQEFTIGGITGNYPDSDITVIGPVILTSQWRKYTIDLRGKNLSYISGGFAWTTSENVNSDDCIFYLDEIRFE
ncbi:MAG: hypothetical protein K8S27_05000 [Candidatus Omnitrophica bacterium]|nr:hypothetical protein [Candidatus Omnitrophota bacterium]